MSRYCCMLLFLMFVVTFLCPGNADIRKDCRRESRVTWDALRRLKSGDLEQDDPRLKCYFRCFMMRIGILNGNSEVDEQKALRHLPQSMHESSKKLFNVCKFSNGTDPCDKAYQMMKCYMKHHPTILRTAPIV